MAKANSIIGAAVGRVEGADKVSGAAIYGADVHFADALWGKILRSPYPHARIKSIDTSKAWKVPGVKAIVTGKDEPEHYQGKSIRDIPVLCWDKVRYIGDKVAAVAAESADAAEEAVNLIEVEYEELPAVFDVLEAMQPGAPVLHDNAPGYEGAPADIMAPAGGNVLNKLSWGKGDIEKGFAEADLVLEHTFRMPIHHQGYLEPQSFLVKIDDDGTVNAWASTKGPFGSRAQFAKAAGHSRQSDSSSGGSRRRRLRRQERRRRAADLLFSCQTGQAAGENRADALGRIDGDEPGPLHGGQSENRRKARRAHDRALSASDPRHRRLCGNEAGARQHRRRRLATPYKIGNTYMEALQVYTNTVPCGFWRAPGAIQAVFASESHMDLLAKELKMDPAKFRMMNLVGEGEENGLGKSWSGVKAKETLKAALDAAGWSAPKRVNVGRGVAMYERGTGAGKVWVNLTAEQDGTLTVFTVAGDQGTGLQTILCQTVAK